MISASTRDNFPTSVASASSVRRLLDAVQSASYVSGLTHRFYRYPARFSPKFAARAIEAFTSPGDFVMDPFMGGGTSVVEALALGRRVLGCDINALAGFLAKAKTTPLTRDDVLAVGEWHQSLQFTTNLRLDSKVAPVWRHYQRNLPWWLRKTLELALASTGTLVTPSQRRFARCSLMRSAQWALDCRAVLPTRAEFLERHARDLDDMLAANDEYTNRLIDAFGRGWRAALARHRRVLVRSAEGLHEDERLPGEWGAPRLVLTSPPYVGVHILYHRWQVRGRRETSAPYWLAGELDGRPNSYYNFADRRQRGMEGYLSVLRASYRSIVALMDEQSVLVQLVAFARPQEQLSPFLTELEGLGLVEHPILGSARSQPISREVPNRKWYADAKGQLGASQEFLLIHRKPAA
jgi:DNA methylase